MHLIPRWKVLLGGIILLLCAVTLVVRPSIQLTSVRPYLVSPWSPDKQKGNTEKDDQPPLKYKPDPTFAVPPIRDPFPLLSQTTSPPPIPAYNVPKKDAWRAYAGVEVAPPLLIGFTRNWPMLLQTVVSYLTAGWPAEQVYVVENTGTQLANARGLLDLQNPRFLNHTQLTQVLGVRVVQTPVLLSFAQLQNFYLALSYEHAWPYYFWSHMDVVALSHEAGVPGLTAPAGEPGYKSLYTLCLETLQQTIRPDSNNAADQTHLEPVPHREKKKKNSLFSSFSSSSSSSPSPSPPSPQPRWAARFFAYDHLTLQNPKALEAIGGWDTFIPYYMTDCDAYSRFAMDGWSVAPADAGVVTDTASVFDDLRALYRDPGVEPRFTDPNPPPPPPPAQKRDVPYPHEPLNMSLPTDYWWRLRREADNMFHHKHSGRRGRNTWQWAQRGGREDPFYYDPAGFEEAVQVLTEAGRNVFARKWGHRDCDLRRYRTGDQWRVEKDW